MSRIEMKIGRNALSLMILDDLHEIERIDRNNMLSLCIEAPKHVRKAIELAKTASISYSKPETIIVAGMGGSAIGGELLKDWVKDKVNVPVEVCKEYSLPAFANEKTLVFTLSYSGETEETLSMFLDAIKKNCMIFCISSGGRLQQFAEKLELPHLQVPSGMPPRAAFPYLFMPLLRILEKIKVISNIDPEISEIIRVLKQSAKKNTHETPFDDNPSKILASKIQGTIPITYGFGIYRAVAQRYKQQFNENSKVPAKWNFLPELNHNEIMGWEDPEDLAGCFSTIFIRDEYESKKMKYRIEATKDLMLEKTEKIFEVWSIGERKLARMLYSIYVGDLTSVYLAILRSIDPTPVRTISLLKNRISKNGVKNRIVGELEKVCKK
jgi:glucose/mannose-6-phosphate isomerase